ncbi:MAG: hypothetical protein ACXAE3_12055 [Candidatus Kariarchaeaceae archaeon]|jgi:hypothetical protein
MSFNLKISPNLKWDNEAFVEWMVDIIFDGADSFGSTVGGFFKQLLSFLEITPVFSADFSIKGMSSGKGGLFSTILDFLGADLTFSGKIFFKLQLLSFKAGGFDVGGFVKLLTWGLGITITISRDFTIFDVVTAGAGGGALNKAAKYIGLDSIVITFYVGVGFEIIFKAAQNGNAAQTTLTLTLTVGASIKIGFSLAIVGLTLSAGIDVTLKFVQDLSKDIFKITLGVVFWVKVELTFLFFDWTGKFTFKPPGSPYDLTPKTQDELKNNAFGFDLDGDGLSDDLEANDPLLDPNNPDTDGDGLNDKIEIRVSKTDPSLADTDGDGLSDFQEWVQFKTDVLRTDTDMDQLSDYEEIMLLGTNALSPDTDNDGLTDYFEATVDWDITLVTTSVTAITIGVNQYDTRTDPLNPDTDNDGLLDGEEGEFGNYYGILENYYPEGDNWYTDPDNPTIDPALIFNEGYTHPLDNDTDDDSYAQYHTGEIAGFGANRVYLRDMRDGVEVAGITEVVVEVDEDGFQELVEKTFFTNPTNPDSDGDTATDNPRTKTEGLFLNSDGYELALDPALNPLDADVDGDGLVDGLEGTVRFDRISTTNPTNPDTDGDGLPDGLEFTLGSDPANPDTDGDLVLDGAEFFDFHTSPFQPDTDFDGLTDGWELFFSHSNPHSKDTDADGLEDAEEVLIYGTDPVDEDSDNDNLSDRDEVLEYETDPNNDDSDEDGLKDSEEVLIYFTDPFNPDSDSDSILYPDENGDPTFFLSDYLEVRVYNTNPLSKDTDRDGIDDGWEIYLADFDIPGQRNIPVDPLNNDTDGDSIMDGHEMQVNRTANLVYPYFALTLSFPFSSSPVLEDTDGDLLSDRFEWDNNMALNNTDSDGDGLPDYDELFIHLTDPTNPDTDGDGITDSEELTLAEESLANNSTLYLSQDYSPEFATSALDSDSDGDGWPDGLEIYGEDNSTLYNPFNDDVNQNGIKDGYERDFDSDQISDGDEYYTFNSYQDTHGGFLDYRNPDSDMDGLMDGDEILVYGTLPYSADSDFDTYSDGLELLVGTDPLVFTSQEEFLDAVRRMNSPLQIRSPEHGRSYLNGDIEVQVVSAVKLSEAYFRYRVYDPKNESHGEWEGPFDLQFKQVTEYSLGAWESSEVQFENGTIYQLEAFGLATEYKYETSDQELKDVLLTIRSVFAVNNTYWLGIHPNVWIGGGAAIAITGVIGLLSRRGVISISSPFKRLRGGKK